MYARKFNSFWFPLCGMIYRSEAAVHIFFSNNGIFCCALTHGSSLAEPSAELPSFSLIKVAFPELSAARLSLSAFHPPVHPCT
jgi:hypothetical protein